MTEDRKKQIALARVNGDLDRLYAQDVRKKVRHSPSESEGLNEGKMLADEVAILRKMVKHQNEILVTHLGLDETNPVVQEFNEYFEHVEAIKRNLKEEFGI